MRPWQPDLFNKAPDPKPSGRKADVRPYEPARKGPLRKAELSEKTILALADWANSQPSAKQESDRYPSSSVALNRKERTSEPAYTPETTGNDHE